MAEPLRAPVMRSPSQWPGTGRVATSAGRATIEVIGGIWPRRVGPSRPRSARLAGLTPRRQQFETQGAAWPHLQRGIEGLGREMLLPVVRICTGTASGNLLEQTALSQRGPHLLPQPGVQARAWSPWLTGAEL